jgi:hypothetical protein
MTDPEPTFTLRASDPLAAMMVRFWANAAAELGLAPVPHITVARKIALQMDDWRRKNRGAIP